MKKEKILCVGDHSVAFTPMEFAMIVVAMELRSSRQPHVPSWKEFSDLLKPSGAWPDGRLDQSYEWDHLRKLAHSIRSKLQQNLPHPLWADRLSLTHPPRRGRIEIDWPSELIKIEIR
jgi:hypothetical protein